MPYFSVLGCKVENHPRNAKFQAKIKILKFETKNAFASIFTLKIGKKTTVIFGINTLKFA